MGIWVVISFFHSQHHWLFPDEDGLEKTADEAMSAAPGFFLNTEKKCKCGPEFSGPAETLVSSCCLDARRQQDSEDKLLNSNKVIDFSSRLKCSKY